MAWTAARLAYDNRIDAVERHVIIGLRAHPSLRVISQEKGFELSVTALPSFVPRSFFASPVRYTHSSPPALLLSSPARDACNRDDTPGDVPGVLALQRSLH